MGISARPLALALFLAVLATIASLAKADMKPVGVVTTLSGTATIARNSLPEPVPLKRLDGVFLADRVTTHENSLARILLGGKALVTVRERSVLTVTEVPGLATVEVGPGGVALAVVKERMRRGEAVEIRTPNAVAGVRGTVVIAEVQQATAAAGDTPAAFTTTFTVLRGVVDVHSIDPLSGRPTGAGVSLGAFQTLQITGAVQPGPPQPLPAETASRLVAEYRTSVPEAPATANAAVVQDQVRDATSHAAAVLKATPGVGGPGGNHVNGARNGAGQAGKVSATSSRPSAAPSTGGVSIAPKPPAAAPAAAVAATVVQQVSNAAKIKQHGPPDHARAHGYPRHKNKDD